MTQPSIDISNSSDQPKAGFFRELNYRRVPHVLGLYMVGSWTFLEFLDSIIGRHNLSPHWADISLISVFIMLPTVIILAYRHGAPGAQDWTYVEKLGLPINVMALIAVLFFNYAGKDLGARAEMIETLTPDGTMMTLVRPKEEYRKRLYISFFKLRTDAIHDSMKYGVSYALSLDLNQDPYINSQPALTFERPLVEAEFTDMTAPLALMLNIARDNRLQYLLDGYVSQSSADKFSVTVNIYHVKDGRKLHTISSSAYSNLFLAIDELTPRIKTLIQLPEFITDEHPDFPIEEQLTSSSEAYHAFIEGLVYRELKSDFSKANELFSRAIGLDSSFALAASNYTFFLLQQSRINEALEMLKKAEQHSYRLHINQKFELSTIGNIFKGQHTESMASLEQWLSLYPDSIEAWSAKANYHQIVNQREEAIKALEKLLQLDPYGINRYITIGELYLSLGNTDAAIATFKLYLEENPANARVHIALGDSYRRLGNFELANQEYRRAQVLDTNNLLPHRRLIENIKRSGEFLLAEQRYQQLADEANSAQTKYEITRDLVTLYLETGRQQEALKTIEASHELLAKISPENSVLMTKIFDAWTYAQAGEFARGEILLNEATAAEARFDNDLYRANLILAKSMFEVYRDSTKDSIPMLDKVHNNVQKYIGNGNDHVFVMMRGIAYHLSDRHQQAIPLLSDYLNEYPYNNFNLWMTLAESQLITNQVKQAVTIYDNMLKEYPMFAPAHLGLAKTYFNAGELEQAKTAIDTALKIWGNADSDYHLKREALELAQQLQTQS